MNNLNPIYASMIISNGVLVNFFMNEIATNKGVVVLDDNNKIVTVALYTQDDVMKFLDKVVLAYQAEEIEI